MQKPIIPKNESKRLKALRDLNILDTPSAESFDRLTQLAKCVFEVPIALISLVDENRQWFKSANGIHATETPRDISFCAHAINRNEILVVPDTSNDERFFDNPLVTNEPYIRFYAGYPLKHTDNSTLGTLCIIDTRPRHFNEQDLKTLADLGALAECELMSLLNTMDKSTDLSNRSGFITLAKHYLESRAASNNVNSLLLFKLDKNIIENELIDFSNKLKITFNQSALIGRIKQNQFAILLKGVSNDSIQDTIKQLDKSSDYSTPPYSVQTRSIDPKQPLSIESLLQTSWSTLEKTFDHTFTNKTTTEQT